MPEDRFVSVRVAIDAFIEAITGVAPIEQPTESICFAPPRPYSQRPPVPTAETVMAPVAESLKPLAASLPPRGSERRPTTIAAGVVMAAAAAAMLGIIVHRSPPPNAPVAAARGNVETAAPPTVAVNDLPEPSPLPEAEPHLSEPAVPPAAPVPKRTAMIAPKPVVATDKPPLKRAKTTADDDDLVRLTNASAQHAEPATPPPAPSSQTPPAEPFQPDAL
jgi:hypothetical protein